jgi:gamma-glutamylaminecyclotransferase
MADIVDKADDAEYRLMVQSEHRLRAENLPFDIDVWYPILKQFTFRTVFRPFSRQEGKAVMHYYQRRYLERGEFCQLDEEILLSLRDDLDKTIKTQFPNGAFLRLCGRSPKDAEPLQREQIWQDYQARYEKLIQEGKPKNVNTKLQVIANINWMCVRNGDEAMSLLLTSERVFADLHDWIRYGEPEQIVLREFDPRIRLDYEFRTYIHKNQLNAISQYDHYAVYPHLFPIKEKIQQRIIEKWKEVHPHVGEDSYCMDFIYYPDTDEVCVIEISPFLTCTGAALFHWVETKDILENGPLEFRLNQKEHLHLADLVEANWEDRWKQKIPPWWQFFKQTPYREPPVEQKNNVRLAGPVAGGVISSGLGFYFLGISGALAAMSVVGVSCALYYFFNQPSKPNTAWKPKNEHLLFVYGTLKKGFHWNSKFLSTCEFIGAAVTKEQYPLVFGDCDVPYLLGDLPNQGRVITGELWKVDGISLAGMDDYEGCTKGYYDRRQIPVMLKNSKKEYLASAYFKTESSEDLRSREFHSEYTLEYHLANYRPIRHIQVKQQKYLGLQIEQS